MNRAERISSRLFLLCFGLFVAFCILEISARLYLHYCASTDRLMVFGDASQVRARLGNLGRFTQHRYLSYVPTPNYETDENRHNRLGFRGSEIDRRKSNTTYRIVAIGGSTTYSDGVKNFKESYPALLQKYLRESGKTNVEVVNAGVPGYASIQSLINLQSRVLELEPDLVMVYHGINDLRLRIVWPSSLYKGDDSGFYGAYDYSKSIAEHSTFLRCVLTKTGYLDPGREISVATGTGLNENKVLSEYVRQRQSGEYPRGFFEETPLEHILEVHPPVNYERNLRSMVHVAHGDQIKIVLVTFAASSREYEARNMVAWPEFRSAISDHNAVMANVAATTGADVFDLAARFPDLPEYFTDGVHFTKAGNQLRAELLGAFLLENDLAGRTYAD